MEWNCSSRDNESVVGGSPTRTMRLECPQNVMFRCVECIANCAITCRWSHKEYSRKRTHQLVNFIWHATRSDFVWRAEVAKRKEFIGHSIAATKIGTTKLELYGQVPIGSQSDFRLHASFVLFNKAEDS